MHERRRDARFQLDDCETQRGNGETPRAVNGAVPLELGRRGQTELVGEVPPLVVVLPVLMLVECQQVDAVLVAVDPVLPFLTQFEQGVQT